MPRRLTPGPIASATHPNPIMPAMAQAIPPVLKAVKTRPSRGTGVISWSKANTTGVSSAVLPPMISMKPLAISGVSRSPNPPTASPPTAMEPEIILKRRCRFPCRIHTRQVEVANMPTPRIDQSAAEFNGTSTERLLGKHGEQEHECTGPQIIEGSSHHQHEDNTVLEEHKSKSVHEVAHHAARLVDPTVVRTEARASESASGRGRK